MYILYFWVIAMYFFGISLCFYNWFLLKGFYLFVNVLFVLMIYDEDLFFLVWFILVYYFFVF